MTAPAAPPPDVLRIRNLSAGYGGVPILRDVNVTVREAEVVAVIGRNGVGKTTLIRAAMGLVRQTAGSVTLHGEELTQLDASSRARRGVAYVPQGRGIFGRLSVEENLRMGELIGNASSRESYEQVLALFPRLRERLKQRAGTLSGGEQQMLALGRVLVGKPACLLLDEPSEGLAPAIVETIGDTVRQLSKERRLSVLLVEQNAHLVRHAADRCEVIEKGNVVAQLAPEDLGQLDIAKRYLAV